MGGKIWWFVGFSYIFGIQHRTDHLFYWKDRLGDYVLKFSMGLLELSSEDGIVG